MPHPPSLNERGLWDPTVHPQIEDYWGNVNPIGRRSCYDEGKRCAETLFFDYHRQHGLNIKVARIFNTYGPRMHQADGRVVSNFVMQALRDKPITLYGTGKQTRSFCYVDDLIQGLIRLMESAQDFRARSISVIRMSLASRNSRRKFCGRPTREANSSFYLCRLMTQNSGGPTSRLQNQRSTGSQSFLLQKACSQRSNILRHLSAIKLHKAPRKIAAEA